MMPSNHRHLNEFAAAHRAEENAPCECCLETDEFLQKIGARIRQLREVRGLRQEDFDDDTSLAVSTRGLQEIEYGRKDVRICTLRKIARRLGLSIKDVFDFED